MSAGSHWAAPAGSVSTGGADGLGAGDGGATEAGIDGAGVTIGDALGTGATDGDGVGLHAASAATSARNGAAARMEVRPRRSAMDEPQHSLGPQVPPQVDFWNGDRRGLRGVWIERVGQGQDRPR